MKRVDKVTGLLHQRPEGRVSKKQGKAETSGCLPRDAGLLPGLRFSSFSFCSQEEITRKSNVIFIVLYL